MINRVKTRRIKSPFTLLEIVVCLAILTLVSGVIGIKIKQATDRHRFESSFNQLVYELKKIQMLALGYRSEFGLEVQACGGEYQYAFFTDEPHFTGKLTSHTLEYATGLSFNNRDVETITFTLLADGRILPEGKLAFHYRDEVRMLDLTSPLQIKTFTR
jgi:type II secretory pathway pseudopilin PulG